MKMKFKLHNSAEVFTDPAAPESALLNGRATYTAGATIKRGECVKFSSGKVVPCSAATDAAIGVALDAAAANEIVPVAILGNFAGTVNMLAGGAVTQGALVTCIGTVSTAGSLTVGRALNAAAAANDWLEIAHCVQIQNGVAAG